MDGNGYNSFQDLPLRNLDGKGSPPPSRLANVKDATDLYTTLRVADEPSAANRARVQAMFDGVPPYSEAALRESGQAFRCNLNYGNGEAFLEGAMSAYVDLINSVDNLVTVETTFGETEQRKQWEDTIAEEITVLLRQWPKFNHAYMNLCNHFVAHGVGIAAFDDEWDWRWQTTGLGDILIPRQTPASESDIEVAIARRPISVSHLFARIKDEEKAKEVGWDVEAVKTAIMKATGISSNFGDWENLARELKNNDLSSNARAAMVNMIHLWVQEFDGTVSHYSSLDDGTNERFLRKSPNRYTDMGKGFIFFPYGVGTNGTYHGIRGLGFKIYPHVQIANRLRSQMVDSAMLSSSVMLQPEDERAIEAFSFNYMGPFALLSPGMTYVERAIPNMSTATMPVLNDMMAQMNDRVGQYSTSAVFGSGGEKTRFEVAAHLESASRISVTALNLFYEPWDRLMRETVRRLTREGYIRDLPGGMDAEILRQRCLDRGVPLEALYGLKHSRTRSVRAVGAGSQAKRMVALQQLNEYAGSFDSVGRARLQRDQVAALVGYDQAERYVPPPDGPRLPIDAKLAQLENAQLEAGVEIEVLDSEMDAVHLEMHIQQMNTRVAAVEKGEMLLEDGTKLVLPVFQHCQKHLENMQGDPNVSGLYIQFRDQLKSFGEILNNGLKRIAAQEKKAAQEQQAAAAAQQEEQGVEGQDPNAVTPEMVSMLAEHRLKLKMLEENHQMKMAINLQEAEQKRQIEEANAARDLRQFLK